MKTVSALDILVAYANNNIPFHISTNASDYQMGALSIQQQWLVAHWSCNLTETQQKYHTMEKELRSICIVLKEFRFILFGVVIFVYINKKISHLSHLTAITSYTGTHTWNSMDPLSLIIIARKMSFPIHSHSSILWYVANSIGREWSCCSLISLLQASTSSTTLNRSSAYYWLMSQWTTLLNLNGYTHNKKWACALSW